MSIADQLIGHGNAVLFAVDSDEFTILDGAEAGKKFIAHVQVAQPTDPELLLGNDKRERSMLYCIRPFLQLAQGNKVSGLGATWQVVDRNDNPDNDTVNFEIVKIVDGIDG